jgi:hypothetical protein
MSRVSTHCSKHPIVPPKQKLFVERAVWESIQELIAHALEDSLESEEALVRNLHALSRSRGLCISGREKDGNARSSQRLSCFPQHAKAQAHFSGAPAPGPLVWCASCRVNSH